MGMHLLLPLKVSKTGNNDLSMRNLLAIQSPAVNVSHDRHKIEPAINSELLL